MKAVFIGLAGSGKTTWGRHLASLLDLPFNDLDALVEASMHIDIPNLFRQKREGSFRKAEKDMLRAVLSETTDGVLATGGGTPFHAFSAFDRTNAYVIWLNPPLEAIETRLKESWSSRPLFAQAGEQEWHQLLRAQQKERHASYSVLADEIWTTSNADSLELLCQSIADGWDGLLGQG